MPRLGLNSWTTGEHVELLTDIRVAAEAGFDLLEVKETKIERALTAGIGLAEIARALQAADLGVLDVNTLDQATLAEGAELDALASRCRSFCEWAAALGAPYVIVGPTYLAAENTLSPSAIREQTVRSLARYASTARASGVKIAFEFHGYTRASIHTLGDALATLDLLGSPDVVLLIDTFHFYVGSSDIADLRRIRPGQLAVVHLADVDHADRATLGKDNRVLPGCGIMPLDQILRAVRDTGFAGPYTIELFRQEYWAMDPARVASLAIDAMRSVL